MTNWRHEKTSRHQRGYGSAWDRLRTHILERDNYLCQVCLALGRLTPLKQRRYDHAVDHIIPKAQGGTDDPSNLQAICRECHWHKTEGEAAKAQGRREAHTTGLDGWPV